MNPNAWINAAKDFQTFTFSIFSFKPPLWKIKFVNA